MPEASCVFRLDTRTNLGHGLRVDFHVDRSISILFLSLIVSVDSLRFCRSLPHGMASPSDR